jgi:RHH-type transcriptional regulator, proline utilization regulon repressor / proline dehydrogenase / delta 1-pyrroline-5-carboxylate dehydrogenase
METSLLIKKAQACIQSVKDQTLTLNERCEQAIVLAAFMMDESQRIQTKGEKNQQAQLAGMMNDPIGKVFTTMMTDQCFRSHRSKRAADQLVHVIENTGIPHYLTLDRRLALKAFSILGKSFSSILVPLTIHMIRQETRNVILPGELPALIEHIEKRHQEGVRINLNHLGEAILGEYEAKDRLQIYLDDLANPEIEYISIKISTIYSQINLLAWDKVLEILAQRLRQLYRMAMQHPFKQIDGLLVPKFVNLDMEEYRDLQLTVDLFCKVLDEPEFMSYKAGIVLQSYLPDSFEIQKQLTQWALDRVKRGGVPIKIRLVKGANLAMEQYEAALRLWPQAPYNQKSDVDANYKRMVSYGCGPEHARAVHLGIGSHNLFDIAYALLLRSEKNVEREVNFEMLEGMADHMRRVVQQLSGEMVLYCPVATKEEFQNAVAYLVRRLDENTAPENFLRHAFDLNPGTPQWYEQAEVFSQSCLKASEVSFSPRRQQNRLTENFQANSTTHFQNEADTDWSLAQNRQWAHQILEEWKHKTYETLPLVIAGKEIYATTNHLGQGEDPSYPNQLLFQYALSTQEQVDQALQCAKENEILWSHTSLEKRIELIRKFAQLLRQHRGDLIGAMVANTGKTIAEADVEVSEAIDFADYYCVNSQEWFQFPDIQWQAKGTVLVTPPWNFPCSISAGGIIAALITGNCVIFKPATEAIWVGWLLAQYAWEAGISKEVLQFITCDDEPVGSLLIKDPRVNAIILTGATETAKLFLKMRPGVDLMAETGGKNTMVITALADRDLAIKDLIQSAFGHAGQKCSACSLAILEAEVYDDMNFRQQLYDAAASLTVGSPWDSATKINPLIHSPNPILHRGLTQLDAGEEWLLEPKEDAKNPNLWSPGIKLGVKPSSFTFQNELFGPVLGLIRAETVDHAFEMMNQTPYGLTAGIHSLDEREQKRWLETIEAGNCYINRTVTGAIVERQPFGGCKESSFGKGLKAGGPNYLTQLMHVTQFAFPQEQAPLNNAVQALTKTLISQNVLNENREKWNASVRSDAFYWKEYFSQAHDPALVLGQDNLQCYVPYSSLTLRAQPQDQLIDLLRIAAAALTCETPLEISIADGKVAEQLKQVKIDQWIKVVVEQEANWHQRLQAGHIKNVRMISDPSKETKKVLAETISHFNFSPVLMNGRLELLYLLREMSVSRDYHRYGNLGPRENEQRTPLPTAAQKLSIPCEGCLCHG